MDKIKAVEKEIEKIISKSPLKIDNLHSKLTKKWVLKLKPDADEALQIAALAHDIDRGATGITESDADFSNYNEFKREHGKRSAMVIRGILEKHGFEEDFIKKVEHLVSLHEFGGDEEADILKVADSIAFFEENIKVFFERCGREKTKFKIKFMFERMTKRAKRIVRGFKYEDPELNSIFREVVS
jgi:hypothetical protein